MNIHWKITSERRCALLNKALLRVEPQFNSEQDIRHFELLISKGAYHAESLLIDERNENTRNYKKHEPHALSISHWLIEATALEFQSEAIRFAWSKAVRCQDCRSLLKAGGELLSALSEASNLPKELIGLNAFEEDYIEVMMRLHGIEGNADGFFIDADRRLVEECAAARNLKLEVVR